MKKLDIIIYNKKYKYKLFKSLLLNILMNVIIFDKIYI